MFFVLLDRYIYVHVDCFCKPLFENLHLVSILSCIAQLWCLVYNTCTNTLYLSKAMHRMIEYHFLFSLTYCKSVCIIQCSCCHLINLFLQYKDKSFLVKNIMWRHMWLRKFHLARYWRQQTTNHIVQPNVVKCFIEHLW